MLSTHPDIFQTQKYRCQHCDFKSTERQCLKIHISRKHAVQVHNCELCDYKSVKKTALNSHIIRLHPESLQVRIHKCHQCDYQSVAVDKTTLNRHIQQNHSSDTHVFKCGNYV